MTRIRWNWIPINEIQLKRAVDTDKAKKLLSIKYFIPREEQAQGIKVSVSLGE